MMVELRSLRRQSVASLRILVLLTIVLGMLYPLSVWAISRLPGLHENAEGAELSSPAGGVYSPHIGLDPTPKDPAADPFFHTRPSASAHEPLGPADTSVSGGSNLSSDNPRLVALIGQRRELIAHREGVAVAAVPADAVTASGSGLDPDISPDYAQLQVPRVSAVTGLSATTVTQLVESCSSGRQLGFLGEPTVNVARLNAAVRQASARPR